MRAAMYMPDLRPGSMSWTIYQGFATALRRQDIDFELITDAPASPPTIDGTTFLPVVPGRWDDRMLAPLARNRRFVATVRALRRYLRARPDLDLLYIEIAYPWGAAATLAARFAGWPGRLVITPMGEDILVLPELGYGFSRYPFPRRMLAWTLGHAAAIRCISPLVKERISTWADRPHAVIPLNVAPDTVAAARAVAGGATDRHAARAELRERLGLGNHGIVLSLGRLHPFKGIHVLVEAMAGLAHADLVIVGGSLEVPPFGDYGEYLRRRAIEIGVADRVHLLGGLPHHEVLEIMAAADVLVVPSILESMNRVCVEAAAAGTPFVVTETTGIAGYLDDDGVGLTVPPDDSRAIADRVGEVLDGSWQPDSAAMLRLVERFDADDIAPQVKALFEAALAG